MSKRNKISYVKPQDPSFLAKLKAQIGYSESGPTTDTKRQKLQEDCSDSGGEDNAERPERDDEQPQIVVLRSGDLTAEEVAQEQIRQAKEAETAPADLNLPIVFKKRNKSKDIASVTIATEEEQTKATCAKPPQKEKKSKSKAKRTQASKLSFNGFDEEEEEELEADQ